MGQAEGGRIIATLQEGGEEMSKEAMKGLPTFSQVERRDVRFSLSSFFFSFSYSFSSRLES